MEALLTGGTMGSAEALMALAASNQAMRMLLSRRR